MASPSPKANIPIILFEGWKVYQALTPEQQKRTSPENVSDVLDAIVRTMRQEHKEAQCPKITSASTTAAAEPT